MMQARTGAPSTSTVQAPHTPCSQPTCVPVEPQVVTKEIGQQLADGNGPLHRSGR